MTGTKDFSCTCQYHTSDLRVIGSLHQSILKFRKHFKIERIRAFGAMEGY
jgi:hypothetical protein